MYNYVRTIKTTYVSVDLAHYEIFRATVGKDGIKSYSIRRVNKCFIFTESIKEAVQDDDHHPKNILKEMIDHHDDDHDDDHHKVDDHGHKDDHHDDDDDHHDDSDEHDDDHDHDDDDDDDDRLIKRKVVIESEEQAHITVFDNSYTIQ